MKASARSSAVEPALFRALLDTTIYACVPVSPRAECCRFATFKSPDDGTDVIPVFTDKSKAKRAARGDVHIVAVDGRTFFEMARSATVTINPDDTKYVLYPEEIGRLLDGRTIPPVRTHEMKAEDGAQFFRPRGVPAFLMRALDAALRHVGGVEAAYVAGGRWIGGSPFDGVWIALAGDSRLGDRRVRAVAMALDAVMCDIHMPVAVTRFAIDAPPAWIKRLGLKPVWSDGVPETDVHRLRNDVAGLLPRCRP
jgi:hypothetical protein